MSTIRTLREVDPSGVLLESVSDPIREYLRCRKVLVGGALSTHRQQRGTARAYADVVVLSCLELTLSTWRTGVCPAVDPAFKD